MTITEKQFYGGSAQEAEDSRRTHEFLNNQYGKLLVRYEDNRVILSSGLDYHEADETTAPSKIHPDYYNPTTARWGPFNPPPRLYMEAEI